MLFFTRIDSRLIHGQVAGTWVPYVAPQTFIAASDAAAHDNLRKTLLLQVAPAGVKTNVLDIAKAGRVYNNPKYTGMKTMFVLESPVDVVRLIDEGVEIPEVNVGGVTYKTGMTQLSEAVYASEEDLEAYRELLKRGVKLYVQQLPNHNPVDLAKIFERERPRLMSPLAFILVIVVAFIAGVASVVDERQFHRPLVACTLMGFALGDPTTGIILGGMLELIALGWMNVGAAMAPDAALASCIATVVVIHGHLDKRRVSPLLFRLPQPGRCSPFSCELLPFSSSIKPTGSPKRRISGVLSSCISAAWFCKVCAWLSRPPWLPY